MIVNFENDLLPYATKKIVQQDISIIQSIKQYYIILWDFLKVLYFIEIIVYWLYETSLLALNIKFCTDKHTIIGFYSLVHFKCSCLLNYIFMFFVNNNHNVWFSYIKFISSPFKARFSNHSYIVLNCIFWNSHISLTKKL